MIHLPEDVYEVLDHHVILFNKQHQTVEVARDLQPVEHVICLKQHGSAHLSCVRNMAAHP